MTKGLTGGVVLPTAALIVYLATGCMGNDSDEAIGSDAEATQAGLSTVAVTEPATVACSRRPFSATVLDAEPNAELGAHPSERALRAAVESDPDLPDDAWWLAYRTSRMAQFLVDNGPTVLEAYVVRREDAWRLDIARVCDLRAVEPGVEIGVWRVDTDAPALNPDSSTVHLVINGLACSSGREPAGRLLPLAARYGDDTVELTARLDPVPGRVHTCQGTPPVRRTVSLDEQVGDRELVDGGVYPPAPPSTALAILD